MVKRTQLLWLLLASAANVAAWTASFASNKRQAGSTASSRGRTTLLQATSLKGDRNDDAPPPSSFGVSLEQASWLLPPTLSIAAFFNYQTTRAIFHSIIDAVSGNNWAVADGGKLMADMVRPVLNGPVALSISILLGTLVATTVSTLYNRQISLAKTVVASKEQVRHINLLVQGFPEPYQSQAKALLRDYVVAVFTDFSNNAVHVDTFDRPQMNALLLLCNKYAQEPDCNGILWEVYAGLSGMKTLRADFRSTLNMSFSPAHYANMVALACTILFVFLLETDQDAMQFLLGFQLSICWALLVGTYSLLAVVIYDLSTPFEGTFSVFPTVDGAKYDLEEVHVQYMNTLDTDADVDII